MAQMGQSKSVVGEFMKQKRKVIHPYLFVYFFGNPHFSLYDPVSWCLFACHNLFFLRGSRFGFDFMSG